MSAFSEAVLATTPSAYWRLDEASGAPQDSSGNAEHIDTVYGTPTYSVAGWDATGTGMTFAANSMLEASDSASFDLGTGDYSVMFAVKGITFGTEQHVIGHDGAGNLGQWMVFSDNATPDNITLRHADATSGTLDHTLTTPTDVLDDGSWHLCIITVDRNGNAIPYVDGSAGTPVDVSGSQSYDMTNARPLRIAASTSTGSRQLVGSLDEIAIWKGVILTAEQVDTLYAANFSTTQLILPDADVTTTGWSTAPLWSKIDDGATPDATVISATST